MARKKQLRDWHQKSPWPVKTSSSLKTSALLANPSSKPLLSFVPLEPLSPTPSPSLSVVDVKKLFAKGFDSNICSAQTTSSKSIEEELFDIFSKELQKEIDKDIIQTLSLGELFALSAKLREMRVMEQSIYVEGFGRVPPKVYNGQMALLNHVPNEKFDYRLSWKKDLGGSIEGWTGRLGRFRAEAPWSHHVDLEANDAFFYFALEDDRINFLLLMR